MKIITLTTDFGTSDYFVGAMKGAILAVEPAAILIDITHEISPQDIRAAAFTIFAACQTFPAGTIHVVVVDPGVGSSRRAILAESKNHFFVAPDNGVLSFVYENEPQTRVFHLTNDCFFRHPISATFHGRDVFAPIAGALARGAAPDELGVEITNFARFETSKLLRVDERAISGEIFHIDRFGNCLTNITANDLAREFQDKNFWLEINEMRISTLRQFYAEAEPGELFMIFGSAGFLEIVAFQDSAAKLLNVKSGQNVMLKY